MPSPKQKVVTIPLNLWVKVKSEYESRPDYWEEHGVKSITGLLSHYVKLGVGDDVSATERREEFKAFCEEFHTLKEVLLLSLEAMLGIAEEDTQLEDELRCQN